MTSAGADPRTKPTSILYSSFYDGSEEANARLCEGIGIPVDDGEWYFAEALIDNAAAQLEQQGIVELEWLDARLVDDEPDYRITLTDASRSTLQAGNQLSFYDSEKHLIAPYRHADPQLVKSPKNP